MIAYFGYGANRTSEMMEAMIGRVPEGEPVCAPGYALTIQYWNDIPLSVKYLLSDGWDSGEFIGTYSIYIRADARVSGMLWYLTEQERALVARWEMEGLWYTPVHIVMRNNVGKVCLGDTQLISTSPFDYVGEDSAYNDFINDRLHMLEVAKADRISFLH